MSKDLGDSEHATATIAPLDKAGNPATVQAGSTVFAVSDPSLVTVTPVDDTSAVVQAIGPLGSFDLTVSADADLGDGVVTITDSLTINVVAGVAANLGLGLGVPEPN